MELFSVETNGTNEAKSQLKCSTQRKAWISLSFFFLLLLKFSFAF